MAHKTDQSQCAYNPRRIIIREVEHRTEVNISKLLSSSVSVVCRYVTAVVQKVSDP